MRATAVVVGGGTTGLSVARSLALRGGFDTILFERSSLASGATGKSSGIVRCHYGPTSLAAMAWHSIAFFEEAADEVGFDQVGYIVGVGGQNVSALHANVDANRALGIEVELMDPGAVSRLLAPASTADFAACCYERRGGYADGSRTALEFGRRARAAGARIVQGAAVSRIAAAQDRITGVVLSDGSYVSADVVVVAAGLWSANLLAPLGIEIPIAVERSEVVIVDIGHDVSNMPVLSDLVNLQYLRADSGSSLLAGSSDHSSPESADPDSYSNTVSIDGQVRAVEKIYRRYPTLEEPTVRSVYAGCYDVTPDYNPVIDALAPSGLYVAAGFSGHGFKLSPAVGELVADLVCDGDSTKPDVAARDFRLSRFHERQPLQSPHPYVGAGQMR